MNESGCVSKVQMPREGRNFGASVPAQRGSSDVEAECLSWLRSASSFGCLVHEVLASTEARCKALEEMMARDTARVRALEEEISTLRGALSQLERSQWQARSTARAMLKGLFAGGDLWGSVGSTFSSVLESGLVTTARSHGFRLVAERLLTDVPYVEYAVAPSGGFARIEVVVSSSLRPRTGALGIEIVGLEGTILANVSRPLAQIDFSRPVALDLPAPVDAGSVSLIRVFATGSDVSVVFWEMCKRQFMGFGKMEYRPFVAFL